MCTGVRNSFTRAPPIGIPPSSKPSLACWIAAFIFTRSLANGSFVGCVAIGPVSGSSITWNPLLWFLIRGGYSCHCVATLIGVRRCGTFPSGKMLEPNHWYIYPVAQDKDDYYRKPISLEMKRTVPISCCRRTGELITISLSSTAHALQLFRFPTIEPGTIPNTSQGRPIYLFDS